MSAASSTRRCRYAVTAVASVLLATAPLLLAPYSVVTLTRVLVFALLAASLDLLVGYTGLPSLGHGAYFGVGAYAAGFSAIHVSRDARFGLLCAAIAGSLVAAVAGSVAIRARGVFFLVLTLAIGELVQQLAESWEDLTGGSNGLYGIPSAQVGRISLTEPADVYWFVLACFALVSAGLAALTESPFGNALRGIRDNEARMRALGYHVYRYKLAAFVASGAVAATAGGLLVLQQRLVTPADAGLGTSVLALLAVVIGGEASLWGPWLGAAFVLLLRDSLGPSLGGRSSLVLGLAFIAAVYLLPGGLASALQARRRA